MITPLHVAKGNYFALQGGRSPFKHLVYPMPAPGGLGIHLTIDLNGQARFGPDVEWLDVCFTTLLPLSFIMYSVTQERDSQ